MTIKQFICSDDTLSNLHFNTVYQTILTLISKGLVSMDDFAKIKPYTSKYEIYIEDGAVCQIQRKPNK